MQYSHELIMPNKDLPFKMFLFRGKGRQLFSGQALAPFDRDLRSA